MSEFLNSRLHIFELTAANNYFMIYVMCLIYFVEPEVPEVGYEVDSTKLHDAGFDAYLTGSVFVNLCNLYGKFGSLIFKPN